MIFPLGRHCALSFFRRAPVSRLPLEMSSESLSIASLSESDVLDALPIIGPAVATTSPAASLQSNDIAPSSPYRLAVPQSDTKMTSPHRTPLVQSFSILLSDVDIFPSPFASTSTIAALELLECTLPPLTQRALRYQRRDALRTARYEVFPAFLPAPARSNVIISLLSGCTLDTERTNIAWLRHYHTYV